MKYKFLAETYEALEGTTKRLKKIEILSGFLKNLKKEDRDVMYLLMGRIYPEYDERRIGISNQITIKAMASATGISKDKVINEWRKIGDLGKVAEKLTKRKTQSTLSSYVLTTKKVIENMRKLPELEGKGSINKKLSLITELYTSATPIESLYITRTLIGDLRIGVQESTIRESLAKAFFDDCESAEKIQRAIDRTNDLALVFEMAKKGETKELDKLHLEVGKPIKAMLAQKTESFEAGFKALGRPCAIEYKYDGFRLIIHKDNKGNISLFTRRLENVTKQFPEVVDYVKKYIKGKSFVLDSEAVGFNKKTKKYTSFQHISQRIRRKYDIEKLQRELPVEVNVFDIVYYNEKSYLDVPFKKRAKLIRNILKDQPYKIISSKQIITDSVKESEQFYKKALKDHQEGVMMKNLDAPYKPGRRVGNMLKIKPEEKDLDLVIIGAEYGTGKRSGWLSSFDLGCRGNKKGEYLNVGKVGTGIKEKQSENEEDISFENLTKKLKPYIIKEKGKSVTIKPKIVVSVTYQEIQRSPNYKSGYALRFPRFTALRPDKPLSEIADVKEIKENFETQKRNYVYG